MVKKFSISFGLVNVPIQIHNCTKEDKVDFNMITPCCHVRSRQKLVCEKCKADVDRSKTKKGYEAEKDKYVIFEREEIENLKLKSTKTIEVIGFVPATALGEVGKTVGQKPIIDPILQKEHYYIGPDKAGEKGYSIIYEVLKELNAMAVGRVVLNGKEYTVTVSVWKNLLLLTVLYYPNEVLLPPNIDRAEISERERELGKQLMSAMGQPEIKELKDRYVEAIKELIKARQEGREIKPIEVAETAEVDIAAALEKSLGAMANVIAKPAKAKRLGVAIAVDGTQEMVEI